MAYIVWYKGDTKKKQLSFIQRLKQSKNIQFGAIWYFYDKILMLVT